MFKVGDRVLCAEESRTAQDYHVGNDTGIVTELHPLHPDILACVKWASKTQQNFGLWSFCKDMTLVITMNRQAVHMLKER